jgi:hypothetical protein
MAAQEGFQAAGQPRLLGAGRGGACRRAVQGRCKTQGPVPTSQRPLAAR